MQVDELRKSKHVILHTLIALASVVCFVFVIINFIEKQYFLSAFELLVCLFNLILLIMFNKIIQSDFADKFIVVYSCLILTALMVVFFTGSKSNLTYIWIFLIPCISYVVNGIRLGCWLTAIFNGLTLAIYLFSGQFDFIQFFNLIFALAVIWVIIHKNETIKNAMTNRLTKLAISDPLTKLKNREQLYKIYRQYTDTMMSIAIIEIDNIRHINDKYGYLAGDLVLIQLAKIIMQHRKSDTHAFRIGSDEYAILIANSNADSCLADIRDLFAHVVQHKVAFKNMLIDVQVSIALTSIHSDANNLDDLLQKANGLLQQAKNSQTDKIAVSL